MYFPKQSKKNLYITTNQNIIYFIKKEKIKGANIYFLCHKNY